MIYKRGFTLVELLVVIAIISILAATVVPRVANWIARARMARAVSEIKNADLALTKMLADASKNDFSHFFYAKTGANGALQKVTLGPIMWAAFLQNKNSIDAVYKLYSDIFYELLRRGKAADFTNLATFPYNTYTQFMLDPTVLGKLGTSYMDIGMDPWGNPYQFYPGPLAPGMGVANGPNGQATIPVPWRAHRDPIPGNTGTYTYDSNTKLYEDGRMRGNPPWDGLPGFPAPTDLSIYIMSKGGNENLDQVGSGTGDGGDDINNWDSESGWSGSY